MKKLGKKGIINELQPIIVALVTVGLVLVIGFLIIAEAQDQAVVIGSVNESDATTFTSAYNGTVKVQGALDDIPDWLPIIVITLIGVLLLGLVRMFNSKA